MKKRIIEILILAAISTCPAFVLPNYFKFYRGTLELPAFSEFATWFLVFFIVLTILVYSIKSQKLASVPDGYQKLYNEQNKISKDGVFKSGKLVNGSKYIYTKDGSLSHIEIYKNGVYTHDALNDKHLSAKA